jgi:hypothetical protein
MSDAGRDLARTVTAMRAVVPAKNFEISNRFYSDLGFGSRTLITDRLVEMRLGAYSFLLQNYYVEQWANNCVVYMLVSDVRLWWDHICALDLPSRYDVISPKAPKLEDWGLVAGVGDPSGVLWRIAQAPSPNSDAAAV